MNNESYMGCRTEIHIYGNFEPPQKTFYIFGFLEVLILIRCFIRRSGIAVSPSDLIFFTGIIWGLAYVRRIEIVFFPLECLVYPAAIIGAAMSCQMTLMLKFWKEILVVSVLIHFFQLLIYTFIFPFMHTSFDIYDAFLLGSTLITNIPAKQEYRLEEIGNQAKPIIMLLHIQYFFGQIVSILTVKMIFTMNQEYESLQIREFQCILILTGLTIGLITGPIVLWYMKTCRKAVMGATLGHIIIPFFGYYFIGQYSNCCAIVFVSSLACMYSVNRNYMPAQIDRNVALYWKMISIVGKFMAVFYGGCMMGKLVFAYCEIYDVLKMLATYLFIQIGRFAVYIFFSPLLLYFGYNLNLRKIIITVSSYYLNPINLILILEMFGHDGKARYILAIYTGVYWLGVFLGKITFLAVLKFTKFDEYSSYMRINMNTSLTHIKYLREKYTTILKQDSTLVDADWNKVMEYTDLKHPYKMIIDDSAEHTFVCPHCYTQVELGETVIESHDLIRTARRRMMDCRKTYYIKLYQLGLLEKDAETVLLDIFDNTIDRNDKILDIETLTNLFNLEKLRRGLRKIIITVLFYDILENCKPPSNFIYRLCFYLVNYKITDVIAILYTVYVVYSIWTLTATIAMQHRTLLIYPIELIMILLSKSNPVVFFTGFRNCLKCNEVLGNFFITIILLIIIEIRIHAQSLLKRFLVALENLIYIYKLLNAFRRILLVNFRSYFMKKLLHHHSYILIRKAHLAFDTGKSFVLTEEQILNMLDFMLDNNEVKTLMRVEVQQNIFSVVKGLTYINKLRDHVSTSCQTKYVMKVLLNEMEQQVNELNNAGWIDLVETKQLRDIITLKEAALKSMKYIERPMPNDIFREIVWLRDETNVVTFLSSNIQSLIFNPGSVVVNANTFVDGVFIVSTGLLKLTYEPINDILYRLETFGELPNVDYMNIRMLYEKFVTPICVACVVGTKSIPFKTVYNAKVVAETNTHVLFIHRDILHEAAKFSTDPLYGLMAKLRKSYAINIAKVLLSSVPSYQSVSESNIDLMLEYSFVPCIGGFKTFVIDPRIEELFLLEGQCMDMTTKEFFVGPVYIPKSIKTISFPKETEEDFFEKSMLIEPILLVVVKKWADEYDVFSDIFEHSIRPSTLLNEYKRIKESNTQKHNRRLLKTVETHMRATITARQSTGNPLHKGGYGMDDISERGSRPQSHKFSTISTSTSSGGTNTSLSIRTSRLT